MFFDNALKRSTQMHESRLHPLGYSANINIDNAESIATLRMTSRDVRKRYFLALFGRSRRKGRDLSIVIKGLARVMARGGFDDVARYRRDAGCGWDGGNDRRGGLDNGRGSLGGLVDGGAVAYRDCGSGSVIGSGSRDRLDNSGGGRLRRLRSGRRDGSRLGSSGRDGGRCGSGDGSRCVSRDGGSRSGSSRSGSRDGGNTSGSSDSGMSDS